MSNVESDAVGDGADLEQPVDTGSAESSDQEALDNPDDISFEQATADHEIGKLD